MVISFIEIANLTSVCYLTLQISLLEQLLAKKRKLMELKNKVISQGQIQGQVEGVNSRGMSVFSNRHVIFYMNLRA